jgi:hypothetical protein
VCQQQNCKNKKAKYLPALTAKFENAMPLALISKLSTSTGYNACNGVKPMAKIPSNKNTIAMKAPLEAFEPVSCWTLAEIRKPIQTRVQPMLAKSRRGRRPTLSTSEAPITARTNCMQLRPTLILSCVISFVIPAVSRTAERKYEIAPRGSTSIENYRTDIESSLPFPAHWPKIEIVQLQARR